MLNNLSHILLANVTLILAIVLPIVALALGAFVGIIVFRIIKNKKDESIKTDANKILQEAIADAKRLRKEAALEAKEEILKDRTEFEKEMKDRQVEVRRSEQRITQREEVLDKKEETLDKKIEAIDKSREDLKTKEKEIEELKQKGERELEGIILRIEKVAQMTKEEAKAKLIQEIEEQAKKDAVKIVREIEAAAKEDADRKAKDIISLAIQKCAVDHSSDITTSVVALPSDEMKGRIIGREGRNIRALESATGVDLIIDDTPEAVVISGFDPVRREVARLSLEKLLSDGRIHPGRIEEIVEKTRRDLDAHIKETGEAAIYEAGVFNLHSDIVRLLGRLKYRTSYGQNVLKHSLEVSHLAGLIAAEIGADVALAKRAGLLHDIGKAVDHEVEGTHISIGADLAKKYKENPAVIHCIAAHHGDIEAQSVEAVLIMIADSISGARPGARRETLENYVKRLEKLESIANAFDGVDKSFAIQAGREIRILVKPDAVDDAKAIFMAKDIAKKIEEEMDYPGQIKVNVIRETRSIEYAK
ncbi:MAG: ribonuclease Y [Firmicutes bacterium]|nr:ribonuclease Y [Bacillota bacterium]